MKSSRHVLPISILLLAGIAAYSNTFRVPFVFDGICQIKNNPNLHLIRLSQITWRWLIGFYHMSRPVGRLSFAFNHYFGGLNVFGYHLVNLAIHLCCSICVYFFLYHTFSLSLRVGLVPESDPIALRVRNDPEYHLPDRHLPAIAFGFSLIFAAHPLNTQAVTYIYQRTTALAALFFMAAMLSYIAGRKRGNRKYYYLTGLFALLAFGAKQNTITLPFFIILYEVYFFIRGSIKN